MPKPTPGSLPRACGDAHQQTVQAEGQGREHSGVHRPGRRLAVALGIGAALAATKWTASAKPPFGSPTLPGGAAISVNGGKGVQIGSATATSSEGSTATGRPHRRQHRHRHRSLNAGSGSTNCNNNTATATNTGSGNNPTAQAAVGAHNLSGYTATASNGKWSPAPSLGI